MTSKVLGVLLAILAGLQFIASSASLTQLISPTAAAWFVLIVGALQVGAAAYTGRAATMPADQRVNRIS